MATRVAGARPRVDAVDLLRGVIMIVMALDHTRDYFGAAGIDPTDPATTTVPLFFTRWITHCCAPGFFLLTGLGARLSLTRKTPGELARFLATRGLWLIVLDLIVLRCLGWQFNFDFRVTLLSVLWALGWAMLVLAVLVRLPTGAVASFAVVLIAGHNLLDGVRAQDLGALAPLWSILHAPGFVFNDGTHAVFAAYQLIPWIGVTAGGYALGTLYGWEAERRRRFLLRLGGGLVLGFLLLRWANWYGDPRPWSPQRSPGFTLLSFLNTTKYPPSLLFLAMTLGPLLLFLRAVDRGWPGWLRPALPYGKVPLFYYVLHVVLLHLIAIALCAARFGAVHWMFESPTIDKFPVTQPPGWPLSLPLVYLIWLGVVVALYPLCRWFAGVKQRHRAIWLSYL